MKIVRRLLDLFRSHDLTEGVEFGERDIAIAAELFHPDFELDTTRAPMADLQGRYRGFAAVVDFWRRWLEAWASLEFEEELMPAGDQVLVAMRRQTMRGKGSGVEVEFPPYWHVFTLRDGKVVR